MNRTRTALLALFPLLFACTSAPRAVIAPVKAAAADTIRTRELAVVFIGMKQGIGENLPEMNRQVDSIIHLVAPQARDRGDEFVSIGVALDPELDVGYNYMMSVSHFTEIVAGHGWKSVAAEHFVWDDTSSHAALPQVVVVERDVVEFRPNTRSAGHLPATRAGIQFGSEQVLARYVGTQEIAQAVRSGARVK